MNKEKLSEVRSKVISSAKRAISYKYDDYVDEELLGDFFDEAVDIICKRRKSDTTEIENERYNTEIKQYIIDSFNQLGAEGSASNSVAGNSNSYFAPADVILKSKILQII